MKKVFLLVWISFFFAQNLFPQSYKIKVEIQNFTDSVAYLAIYAGDKQYIVDSACVKPKGHFTFENNNKLEGGVYFIVAGKKALFDFLISGNKNENLQITTNNSDYGKIEFLNSPENSEFQKYIEQRAIYKNEYEKLMQKIYVIPVPNADSLRIELKKCNEKFIKYSNNLAHKNTGKLISTIVKALCPLDEPIFKMSDTSEIERKNIAIKYYKFNRNHFFDNVDFSDERLLRTPFFETNILDYYFQNVLIFKNPDSIIPCVDMVLNKAGQNDRMFKFILTHVFNFYKNSVIMGHEKIVIHIGEKYFLQDKPEWVSQKFENDIRNFILHNEQNMIGMASPNLVLPNVEGKTESIYGIKSKYVVLYFYSPNCDYCEEDTPQMKNIYEKYKNSGVQFYAVNTQSDEQMWKNYIEKYKLDWINVWDPDRTANLQILFNTITTPQIYLLDENKKIIGRRLDPKNLGKFLSNIIKIGQNIP